MKIIKEIQKSLIKKNTFPKIVFPEGEEERIIKAAKKIADENIARPILLGKEEKIKILSQKENLASEKIEIIDPEKSEKKNIFAKEYLKKEKISLETAKNIFSHPLFFATMAVNLEEADGMIAGAVFTSGEVIAVASKIVGLKENIKTPSSFFLMVNKHFSGGEKGNLIFADASVNINPTPEELADIAITTGETAISLLNWEPKIALLSFSTKGSASHPLTEKVVKALEIAQKKAPRLAIDGELQADAALIKEIARKKMKDLGKVAGQANILIFPDLNAANIAYKLTSIIADTQALGPILQGFKKPISDLSRGAKTEEIFNIAVILAHWINKIKIKKDNLNKKD